MYVLVRFMKLMQCVPVVTLWLLSSNWPANAPFLYYKRVYSFLTVLMRIKIDV